MHPLFKAVLFDFIGTTVKESGGDVIIDCFTKAFNDSIGEFDMAVLKINRGKDKRLMIGEVLKAGSHATSLVEPIYSSFRSNLESSLDRFSENEGTNEIFFHLKQKGIKIGVGTGLDRDVFEKIYQRLGWNKYQFDYIGIGSETGRSRPHPDMILDMLQKLPDIDRSELLKVGDTIADIQEGKNAGVATAAILSGSQSAEQLLAEHPDYFIRSLSELKAIIS